jgi:hypothetical protein
MQVTYGYSPNYEQTTFRIPGHNPNLSLCQKYEMTWNTDHPAGQGGLK